MQNLQFFDKDGNYLNFQYNDDIGRYDGDLIFPENSNDTFKTQAMYLFEKIDAFEYENKDILTLRKFQLFNEFGIHFYSGSATCSITKIDSVNSESSYYSKWIYGNNIESIYKKGSFIRFNSSIFEFNNTDQIFCVVGSKKGAIMILSLVDNKSFSDTYSSLVDSSSQYTDKTVTGLNIIGIYNYIDFSTLETSISSWNESDFYDRLYQFRKINVINSNKNDKYKLSNRYSDVDTYTVKNSDVSDIIHYEYSCESINTNLIMEVVTKKDLPLVYSGPLTFKSSGKSLIFGNKIPTILKPGIEFKVSNSVLNNTYFFKVSNIPTFLGNAKTKYYYDGYQVLWQNKIYQCIQSYTWSGGQSQSIFPTGSTTSLLYWSDPDHLVVNQILVDEVLTIGDLYLTSDHIYFTQSFTQSSEVTLSIMAEKFKSDVLSFDIDLYYKDQALKADLIYPSDYCIVNFYTDSIGLTNSVGSRIKVQEKAIEVYEDVVEEFNYDISENFNYNILFTDIDEFGIIIKINEMIYQEKVSWVYSSGVVDMQRTIDKTLRNWLTRNFTRLITLGIDSNLLTIGYTSVYFNSISLKTQFPNVPLKFDVEVGSNAAYFIEHSSIVFYEIGNILLITINNIPYSIDFDTDIATTLLKWTTKYSYLIDDYGIYISNVASSLKVYIKEQYKNVDIKINVGKTSLPGIDLYKIFYKFEGNHGLLLSSNEILTGSDDSFEDLGFSTGAIVGINKTIYPIQNTEFNILYLNPDIINLSYMGPFWGLTSSVCNSSAFTTVAFTIGFGQTACTPEFIPNLYSGMYDLEAFNTDFSITYQSSNNYVITNFGDVKGMVDILYLQSNNSIYVLGDTIQVYDSFTKNITDNISISGLTGSKSIIYNTYSSYIYALSSYVLYKIDPFINMVVSTYSLSGNPYSIVSNPINSDIYVSYDNLSQIDVFNNSISSISTSFLGYDMVFNDFENSLYVNGDSDVLIKIDATLQTISKTFSIPGLTHSILYDPKNESIYVYGSSNLYKVNSNDVFTMSNVIIGATFNNMTFNNYTDSINISSDTSIDSLSVDTDVLNYTISSSGEWGYQVLNQFDGDVYLSGQNGQILIVDSIGASGSIIKTNIPITGGPTTKLIFNPDRESVWFLHPSLNEVIEVQVLLSSYFNIEIVEYDNQNENFYGTLDTNYVDRNYLWLNVRENIRIPRENFNNGITASLFWKWYSDNVPEFFLYDFSGDQLTNNGSLTYIGDKPLNVANLNKTPNRDISKVLLPEYQQTIFDRIEQDLQKIDDNFVTSDPIQVFIGYKSDEEGPLRSVLQLYKKEDIDFTIDTTLINIISFENIVDSLGNKYGRISLNDTSDIYFTADSDGQSRGLKTDQHIAIFIEDITNETNQYLSNNNGFLLKVRNVYSREIIVDYFKYVDILSTETTKVVDYPATGDITFLSVRIKVWDKEIGRFNIFGQTEIEDERYKIELNNVGKLVSHDDIYIFKEYDINEEGIDWTFLNSKRKEMLMMKSLIYPFIGSYKSIINAINYFGYNDLELNEYYRNIDTTSIDYFKLLKVEIPDIFDNSVIGWSDNDFLKHTLPNNKYESINSFNLTYRITDTEGNNVLSYSVAEVQKKLQGLKYWLQNNIIPITHKILDITGRVDFVSSTYMEHRSKKVTSIATAQDFTPITFELNELYLMPVNSGSSVYNCVMDFSIATESNIPDQYSISVKSYEVYREWYAFKNYMTGDKIVYYDKLYESKIDNNKTKNPRKFENSKDWVYGLSYKQFDIIRYDSEFFILTSSQLESLISPILDSSNWEDITEWKEIPLYPIDKISEYRTSDNLYPFNFTIDSNISPYLSIEVTSFNGYGMSYTDKKNYDIKGVLDIRELETFSNLTAKQYKDIILPVAYTDVSAVLDISMTSYAFTSGFNDVDGNYTDRPYILDGVVYPHIKHGYPYVFGNSSSVAVSEFVFELGGDFINVGDPYAISSSGYSVISDGVVYWVGDLPVGSTVSIEVRGDVTVGGKSYWIDSLNSENNNALLPLTYSVISTLKTGKRFGFTQSTQGLLQVNYSYIHQINYPISSYPLPTSLTQSFYIPSGGGIFSGVIEYGVSTFSNYGIDLITNDVMNFYGGSFVDVVDGFNGDFGTFAYAYCQVREVLNTWSPYFLISTYYNISSTQSDVIRTNNGTPGIQSYINSDSYGFVSSGYNSGGITFSMVYYP